MMKIIDSPLKQWLLSKIVAHVLGLMTISLIFANASADQNIDEARNFIDSFLDLEFHGSQDSRVSDAHYSPKRKQLISEMYGPLIGEIFFWESAKLVIVDSYEIKRIITRGATIIAEVKFKEFARTGDKGISDSPLIKTAVENNERYYLEVRNGKLGVVDPPIPRISRKALISFIEQDIQFKDQLFQKGNKGLKKQLNNLRKAKALLDYEH